MPPFSALRSVLVSAKDRIDHGLHDGRRRDAVARLHDVSPTRLLVLCLGNVCRSPYAERRLSMELGNSYTVASAGFIGPGRPPPDDALAVARGRGIEHGDHRSQAVTEEMIQRAEAVFFFDRFNLARLRRAFPHAAAKSFWLGDFDPEWGGKRSIVDPWGKPTAEFERVFGRIDRCSATVVGTLRSSAGS